MKQYVVFQAKRVVVFLPLLLLLPLFLQQPSGTTPWARFCVSTLQSFTYGSSSLSTWCREATRLYFQVLLLRRWLDVQQRAGTLHTLWIQWNKVWQPAQTHNTFSCWATERNKHLVVVTYCLLLHLVSYENNLQIYLISSFLLILLFVSPLCDE